MPWARDGQIKKRPHPLNALSARAGGPRDQSLGGGGCVCVCAQWGSFCLFLLLLLVQETRQWRCDGGGGTLAPPRGRPIGWGGASRRPRVNGRGEATRILINEPAAEARPVFSGCWCLKLCERWVDLSSRSKFAAAAMREIVHIQAGQCGNQIGAKVVPGREQQH